MGNPSKEMKSGGRSRYLATREGAPPMVSSALARRWSATS
jgi:hypothetical protein